MIADYDCIIDYHLGKTNVVTDALSRNSSSLVSHIKVSYILLLIDLRSLDTELVVGQNGALLVHFQVRPILIDQIREMQDQDLKLIKIKEDVKTRLRTYFLLRDDGTLVVGSRLCMPNNLDFKNQILEKAHSSVYAMHLGSTMMYHLLREHYWW